MLKPKTTAWFVCRKIKDQLGSKPSGELVGIVKLSPKLFTCMQRHAKDQFTYIHFSTITKPKHWLLLAKEIDIDCLLLEDLALGRN